MDARDRLRRYLEQRRELGESEFVLDGLPVEDVLRMVGARTSRRTAAARGTDERSVVDRGADDRAVADTSPSGQDLTPPAPAVRFDGSASTDWRDALRGAQPRSGDAPNQPVSPSVSASQSSPTPASPESASSPHAATPRVAEALPAWLAALEIPTGLATPRAEVVSLNAEVAGLASLDDLAHHVAACTRCALSQTARRAVPGEGNPQAEVLCVGEAPGATEDELGRPFVGEAGQLLTKILAAIHLTREEVFICNVLKHRPPGNRDPSPQEVEACQPYLLRQIELVRPKVIIAWGRFAAQSLLQTTTGIGQLRGKLHRYQGVPLIVTYHPAALLRNEQWKRPTWEDVKLARRILDAARTNTETA